MSQTILQKIAGKLSGCVIDDLDTPAKQIANLLIQEKLLVKDEKGTLFDKDCVIDSSNPVIESFCEVFNIPLAHVVVDQEEDKIEWFWDKDAADNYAEVIMQFSKEESSIIRFNYTPKTTKMSEIHDEIKQFYKENFSCTH